MDRKVPLYILWDASGLWGCLALWAALSLGLPYRLVEAREVADGLLQREPPALLLVPGGSARRKAAALGPAGIDATRRYVASGGHYLGFCGGAGLGLSRGTAGERSGAGPGRDATALALCPWRRASFTDKRRHLMSGHLHVTALPHRLTPPGLVSGPVAGPLLPVWWPGLFDPARAEHAEEDGVFVLARYASPGPDLYLEDRPADFTPGLTDFLTGRPCLIHGSYGAGGYVLSYAHLESPASPAANRWFCHLLREVGGPVPQKESVPPWDVDQTPVLWRDARLAAAQAALAARLRGGRNAGLFFERSGPFFERMSWLFGWKPGVPGATLAAARALLSLALSREPGEEALRILRERGEDLADISGPFLPAADGGLYGRLMPLLERLVFLQFRLGVI